MGIIILEGVDCSGKSTIAEELSLKTGYRVLRGSSFEISELGTDKMFEYMMNLLDEKDVIIDRLFMSNYVYGKLFDYPTMSDKQFVELAKKANNKALTVYLTATPETIKSRMIQRGDDMIETNDVERILDKYSEVISNGLTAQKLTFQVNTSFSGNQSLVASMIKNFIDLQETKMFINNN